MFAFLVLLHPWFLRADHEDSNSNTYHIVALHNKLAHLPPVFSLKVFERANVL